MVTTYSGSAIPTTAPTLNVGVVNSICGAIAAVSSEAASSMSRCTAMTTPAVRKVSGTAQRGTRTVPASHTTSTGITAPGDVSNPVTAFMHSGRRTPASIACATGVGMEDASLPSAGHSPDRTSSRAQTMNAPTASPNPSAEALAVPRTAPPGVDQAVVTGTRWRSASHRVDAPTTRHSSPLAAWPSEAPRRAGR